MGWWSIGSGNEMIGDGPADRLLDAFGLINEIIRKVGDPKPSVQVFLHWLLTSLRSQPNPLLLGGSDSVPNQLFAYFEDGTQINSAPGDPVLEVEAVRILLEALEDISLEYQTSEEARKPSLRELLETVRFVAVRRLFKWTSDAPSSRLVEIRAEPA